MKDAETYLQVFRHAAAYLDKKQLKEKEIEAAAGEILDCVFLKLYKRSWTNPHEDPLTARSRIFFSVWVSDDSISKGKLHYNIHAFKLRHLHGYAIESREFATRFRATFKKFAHRWPNVSVDFGPLTLMEGWVEIDPRHFQHEVATLGNRFLAISSLIDDILLQFRK